MKINIFLLLTIISQALWAQVPYEPSKLGHNDKVGKYANIRGFNMYYEVYGKGEPLLFIHGNGGSMEAFASQVPFFAKHYKVILADSRAQGKSIDTSDSLTYEMMADDLNELLDNLKIDSAYVIGWSDGGINALLLAMRHPKKVKKLASTGANLWPDSTALVPEIYKEMVAASKKPLTSPPTIEEKNGSKLLMLMLKEPNIKTTELKKIKCPSLIIGGDHDVIVPLHTLIIAESIPKSYLWILPRSGHSTLVSYKEEFNKTVFDFFKKPYKEIKGADRF